VTPFDKNLPLALLCKNGVRMTVASRTWLFAIGFAALAPARQVFAAGTAAGTAITNSASVSYTLGASTATANSNTTSTTVLQVLDVVATVQTASVAVTPGDAKKPLTFRITNTGNGPDTFILTPLSTLPGDNFDPVLATPASIYFDTDNSGDYSPGDTAYVPGADVNLAADAAITVFVLNNIPTGLNNADEGRSQITAARKAGTGTPGQTVAGGGVGGIDAVFGNSGDQALQSGKYVVANNLTLTAVKTQALADTLGGARPIPGATITYTIAVTPSGTGAASAAAFTDPIPANTTFKPGSIKLNTASLTDAAGDDAGEYLTTPSPQVKVVLGNLTQASGVQTVEFAVTIN
jgi:uncharacterized repeat protein (TIGR01451 family)